MSRENEPVWAELPRKEVLLLKERLAEWGDLAALSEAERQAVLAIVTSAIAALDSPRRSISSWAKECHRVSIEKGWWDVPKHFKEQSWPIRDLAMALFPEKIALIQSEGGEALEVFRELAEGADPAATIFAGSKPVSLDSEMADVIIRDFDVCEALDIDIERAIGLKHAYNETRPHRHGGKRA